MKTKLFVYIILLSSLIINAQGRLTDTKPVSGQSTTGLGASYNYEADVTFKTTIEGLLGDIKVRREVSNYQITSYTYKGIDASEVGYSYPLSINKYTKKAFVDLEFYKGSRYFVAYNLDTETNFPAYLSSDDKSSLFKIFGIDPDERDCITCNSLEKVKQLNIRAKNVKLETLGALDLFLEINKAISEKISTNKRIANLKERLSTLQIDNKTDLLKKKSIYEELAYLDEEDNYDSELKTIETQMENLAEEELEKEELEDKKGTGKTKEEEKEDEDKDDYDKIKEKTKKKKTKSERYVQFRLTALDILNRAKNTNNSSEKLRLLKQAKSYKDYLTVSEYKYIKDEIRRNTSSQLTMSLVNVNFDSKHRYAMIMFNSGFNALFGSYDSQFDAAIPLNISTEFTFPLGKKLALELQGEYSYNYVLKSGDAGILASLLGSDIEQTPGNTIDKETETKYGSYYYAIGLNIGKSREFSILIMSQNIKYYHKETENGNINIELGSEEFIPTYGVSLVYNFLGKSKQELGRLMASYSINDEKVNFINPDYSFNDVTNINIKYEAGYGAFLFGIEYNNFNDKINDVNLSTIGLKLGAKLGF